MFEMNKIEDKNKIENKEENNKNKNNIHLHCIQ